MSVDNQSRQFVAAATSFASTMVTARSSMLAWVALVAAAAVLFVGHAKPWSLAVAVSLFFGVPLAWGGYAWWRSRREIVFDVEHAELTVNLWPDTAFAISDAPLGLWPTRGVALHLQSGSRRFVVGGRDRRVTPSTPLDAPPVQGVDASLDDTQFEQLLAPGGHSAANGRGSTLQEPARCLLFPNPLLAEEFGRFAIRKHLQHQRSLSRPGLILDLDDHVIRVIDPNDGTVTGSAPFAQTVATPAMFQPDSVMTGDATYNYPKATGLVVQIPGLQRVTIGCFDTGNKLSIWGGELRFHWPGVPRLAERPAFVVSAADWLTLTDKFGLTAQLEDRL